MVRAVTDLAYAMPERLDRGRLLVRGAVLLGTGGVAGALAAQAKASVPDADLAYLRLLIGVELLKIDFGVRAGTAMRLPIAAEGVVKPLRRRRQALTTSAFLRS